MLTSSSAERLAATRPPRPSRSLKQEYQEFILQRIEEYKNALPREALLQIGDEAVRELQASAQDQYLLTEVLLLEHVDRIISRRLRLPSFPRWRQAAALPEALFLAAHDIEVFLVDQDLGAVEAAEGRAVTEQLAGALQALVISFGSWFPDLSPSLVVLEPRSLADLRAKDRTALIADLQARTRSGGVHVVLSAGASREVIPLGPEALQTLYSGWQLQRSRRSKRSGFTATKPPRQLDTASNVSE